MRSKRFLIYLPALIYFIIFTAPFVLDFYSKVDFDKNPFSYIYISFDITWLIEKLGIFQNAEPIFAYLLPLEYVLVTLLIFFIARLHTRKKLPIDYQKERLSIPSFVAGSYLVWASIFVNYATTCSEKFCDMISEFAIYPMGYITTTIFGDSSKQDWVLWFTIVLNAILFYVVSRVIVSKIWKRLLEREVAT